MDQNILATICKVASTERESILGRMALSTQESGTRIRSMVKVCIDGSTGDATMVSGWTTTCTDMVCIPGKMADDMKESI